LQIYWNDWAAKALAAANQLTGAMLEKLGSRSLIFVQAHINLLEKRRAIRGVKVAVNPNLIGKTTV
jgi:hypothetical protein